MSGRLDQEREERLQPLRMASCRAALESLGFEVTVVGHTELDFVFQGSPIKHYPYTGWHSGKTIEDGRGFGHLLAQLT